MAIDRRQLLAGLAAALVARMPEALADAPLYVSCRGDGEGRPSAAVFTADGVDVFSTLLPARGHDTVARPGSGEIVVFARRPGNWAVVVDCVGRRISRTLIAREDRHFYGHGAFSPDGRLLYATENDTLTGDGRVGIYDAGGGYRRIGEVASRGIGPHDIRPLPDGRTLAVANGGLRTLPDSGREILNRGDMRPNLAFLDIARDACLGVVELGEDLRALSIRHLAVASDGAVYFGCQHEGDPDDLPPLVGVAADGRARLFDMPELELLGMRGYVGSVALAGDGSALVATSPRGGTAALFGRDGRYLGTAAMNDVCGAAPLGERRFLLSSGNAGLVALDPSEPAPASGPAGSERWMWDNHLRRL